jgi:hypothetical protein
MFDSGPWWAQLIGNLGGPLYYHAWLSQSYCFPTCSVLKFKNKRDSANYFEKHYQSQISALNLESLRPLLLGSGGH